MRGNAESKLSISWGKKHKNNDEDVAMITNLNCKYFYEERFPSFFFFFSFVPFGFLGLIERFFSPRCLSVLLSVLTVYSVCQFVSPGDLILSLRFELLMLFVGFCFCLCAIFSPLRQPSAPEH